MLNVTSGQDIDINWTIEQREVGPFVRNLVGLHRMASIEPFDKYLDGIKFSADKVRFDNPIIDEFTRIGVMWKRGAAPGAEACLRRSHEIRP